MTDMIKEINLEARKLFARFNHPESGYKGCREAARYYGLLVGERYEVSNVVMGASYTDVYLCGYLRPFNSVLFDFEDEDGSAHDIYRDPKYNWFLKKKVSFD